MVLFDLFYVGWARVVVFICALASGLLEFFHWFFRRLMLVMLCVFDACRLSGSIVLVICW